MGVDDAKAWSDFLQAAGGWGVAVVEAMGLVPALITLWRKLAKLEAENNAKDERIFSLLDKSNEILTLITGRATSQASAAPPPAALPAKEEPKP